MRVLFETLMRDGTYATVRGRNACGEYVATTYNGNLSRGTRREQAATYFTNDLADACATAVASVFGATLERN